VKDFGNYRRDLAVLETSRSPTVPSNTPEAGSNADVATRTASNAPGTSHPGGTSFYHDDSDTYSATSQLSPNHEFSPAKTTQVQTSTPILSDRFENEELNDERRPSAASITTASSQGSKTSVTRGGFRKLQGFFGEEFPGRDSSESSLPTSSAGRDLHGRSYSHSRPSQRDRNYSNASTHTRDGSPSSSRPRTPVPAPEVVPFLYQDNTVRTFSFTQYPLPFEIASEYDLFAIC
jgi:adenylate cyclase